MATERDEEKETGREREREKKKKWARKALLRQGERKNTVLNHISSSLPLPRAFRCIGGVGPEHT